MKPIEELPIECKPEGQDKTVPTGDYQIPHPWVKDDFLIVSVHLPEGWEHIMVRVFTIVKKNQAKARQRDLVWGEMCYIKDLFWDPAEVVVQFHPAYNHYIANKPNIGSLWRPTELPLPVPDVVLAGLKEHQEQEAREDAEQDGLASQALANESERQQAENAQGQAEFNQQQGE